ncbi:MAG: hypothetical protein ACK492_09080 [Chitinophagaceae bacterium]|jgi:hypothetical protein
MLVNIFERLELNDEKNLLIQGIPSTLEKYFTKLSFAKNVTPLLKSKKIEFALVFALNYQQLSVILKEVIPALKVKGKLWIAYPKPTSKIVSDLNRDCNWDCLCTRGFGKIDEVVIDHVWTAIRFCTVAASKDQKQIDLEDLHIDATVKDVVVKSSRKYSAVRTAIS